MAQLHKPHLDKRFCTLLALFLTYLFSQDSILPLEIMFYFKTILNYAKYGKYDK